MTLNVTIEEFQDKWENVKDNLYSRNGLVGYIIYEDENYFVIKIKD